MISVERSILDPPHAIGNHTRGTHRAEAPSAAVPALNTIAYLSYLRSRGNLAVLQTGLFQCNQLTPELTLRCWAMAVSNRLKSLSPNSLPFDWADGLVRDSKSDPLGRPACRDHTLRPARRGCAACHRHEVKPTMMV